MGMLRAVLVGHGLGAVVALMFALRNPDTVDRVMAVSCPLDDSMVSSRLRSSSPADLADWLLGRTPVTETARLDAPKADVQAIQTSLANLAVLGLRKLTSILPTACLLVSGQNDPAVAPPREEELNDMPEQTHLVLFDQSGHFPMLDEGSKFNRLLADFLLLESGESPRQLQLKEAWKRRVR
jgi:pimeloyl-ACP methyl ester carboxylesterase